MSNILSVVNVLGKRTSKWISLVAFCAVANFASLHTYLKLLPRYGLAGGLLAVLVNIVLTILVLQHGEKKWMQSKVIFSGVILFFFLEVWALYPVADALKQVGKGTDQDDAVIMSVDQIRAFHYPYTNVTYLGGKISPGPGWVLLHLPLTALGLYQFIGPMMIALSAWYLRRLSKHAANIYLILLLITPTVSQLLVPGSDLISLATAIMLLCFISRKSSAVAGLFWAVVLGFVATARINFISLPIAFLFVRPDRISKRAILETTVALLVATGLHLGFYVAWPDHYAPLHLVPDAREMLAVFSYLMPIAIISTVLYLLLVKVRSDIDKLEAIGWYLFAMHLPLAIGLLKLTGFDFATWIGYEYVFMPLPCFAAALALLHGRSRQSTDPMTNTTGRASANTEAIAAVRI
ncbi:MAG: hypothetical protein JWN45_3270 [Acidobacteriaceae bacterium]|nr:hypothetical protein [Acidobacteriaceae bacterium]